MTDEYPTLRDAEPGPSRKWDGGCLWQGVGVILGGLTLGFLLVIVSLTRSYRIETSLEPEITVLVAATRTPNLIATTTQRLEENQTPTGSPGILLGADFLVGDVVEIYGTEGQGLSIRNEPGLSATVDGYGMEGEIFEIRGGPIEMDGYVWWFLVSPYDDSKKGWGVGAFLESSIP
jgi:hypothetical protein